METLVRLFADLCRFKIGPEDMPASFSLFVILLSCNFIIEMFLGFTVYSFGLSLFLSIVSILTLFAFTWIWLMLFQLTPRFLQTIIAFSGVSLFTNIICFLPLTFFWKMGVLADTSFAMINLLLLVWILSIYAHIYKHTLNISFFLGMALSVTYFITYSTFSNYIIGV